MGRRGTSREPDGFVEAGSTLTETARCDRCGGALALVLERALGPEQLHREFECPGCLAQYSACSAEGFKIERHAH